MIKRRRLVCVALMWASACSDGKPQAGETRGATSPVEEDTKASDELNAQLLEFPAPVLEAAKAAEAGATRAQLGGRSLGAGALSPGRRQVVLQLSTPHGRPEIARLALSELVNEHAHMRDWSDNERAHLLACVLGWLGEPNVRAVAAEAARVLVASGVRNASLINGMLRLCDRPVPAYECAISLRALEAAWDYPQVTKVLAAQIRNRDPQVRYQVLSDLSGHKARELLFWSQFAEPVITSLSDPNPVVRIAAARALRVGDPPLASVPQGTLDRVRAALRAAVKDDVPTVRCLALRALERLGEVSDIHLAMSLVNDVQSCTQALDYSFKNSLGGASLVSLGESGSVQMAALRAAFELSPETSRPAELSSRGRFRPVDGASGTAKIMEAWYARQRDTF